MQTASLPSSSGRPRTLVEAQDFIRSLYGPATETEWIEPSDCVGRIAAHDVAAPAPLPRFNAAAMDGFAVRLADLQGATPVELRLAGLSKAGHPLAEPLQPGRAVRIYTGAVVPPGSDRVVMQEDAQVHGETVVVRPPPNGKPHIRHTGEDVAPGQVVLAAGQRITPATAALLRALQVMTVSVFRPLRVALLSTGDELRESGEQLADGQIIDSNRSMLKAMCEDMGCNVDDQGIISDDADILLRALVDAAAASDLIITSGSASVGAADHMNRLIGRRGCLEFWKLNMRPGKPVGLGDIDHCPVLALPGNPMAAAVAFALIGRPLIGRLSGDAATLPQTLHLPLARHITKAAGRLDATAARLTALADGRTGVEPLEMQGSANLLALSQADGVMLLSAAATELVAGDILPFVRF